MRVKRLALIAGIVAVISCVGILVVTVFAYFVFFQCPEGFGENCSSLSRSGAVALQYEWMSLHIYVLNAVLLPISSILGVFFSYRAWKDGAGMSVWVFLLSAIPLFIFIGAIIAYCFGLLSLNLYVGLFLANFVPDMNRLLNCLFLTCNMIV